MRTLRKGVWNSRSKENQPNVNWIFRSSEITTRPYNIFNTINSRSKHYLKPYKYKQKVVKPYIKKYHIKKTLTTCTNYLSTLSKLTISTPSTKLSLNSFSIWSNKGEPQTHIYNYLYILKKRTHRQSNMAICTGLKHTKNDVGLHLC